MKVKDIGLRNVVNECRWRQTDRVNGEWQKGMKRVTVQTMINSCRSKVQIMGLIGKKRVIEKELNIGTRVNRHSGLSTYGKRADKMIICTSHTV